MAEISVVAITVSCTLLLLEAANFNMINPYYGGFFLSLIKKKLQKLSRYSLLSPSGPIDAFWPNFRPIGSERFWKIDHKKINHAP